MALVIIIFVLLPFTSCGEVDLVLPPHEHHFTQTYVPGNCSNYGYTEYECACRETYREYEEELGSHVFSDIYTTDKEANYEEEGEKSRHCLYCEERTDITVIPKLLDPDLSFIPV
jgi:hypothetical protein